MITVLAANLIIFLVCIFGLVFAAFNAWWVSKIQLHTVNAAHHGETNKEHLIEGGEDNDDEEEVQRESIELIKEIGEHISSVKTFKKKISSFKFRVPTNSCLKNTNTSRAMLSSWPLWSFWP